ncbi:hypothetical protein MSTO_20580 [Mycobacterium stomatepiae]|uniref:Uncharacterized protein n=1 Tax=Mycobacterium stomatepiae TaxID=470076 RepID=A0A7I7Q6G6_9MYCO|nr:hypothetical protein MSTO_20580 [Mycobacterium stomatepiae]
MQTLDDSERIFGADRLAYDPHPVTKRGKHRFKALDHHFVVVNQYHSNGSGNRHRRDRHHANTIIGDANAVTSFCPHIAGDNVTPYSPALGDSASRKPP